jgi:hypothetical protein
LLLFQPGDSIKRRSPRSKARAEKPSDESEGMGRTKIKDQLLLPDGSIKRSSPRSKARAEKPLDESEGTGKAKDGKGKPVKKKQSS